MVLPTVENSMAVQHPVTASHNLSSFSVWHNVILDLKITVRRKNLVVAAPESHHHKVFDKIVL
jgi:hypothetical protein